MLASDGADIVALGKGGQISISTDGLDWSPVASTGQPQVPGYLLGPISVREPSPVSDFDIRFWVSDGGLIVSHTVDSPEGFAVKAMQQGSATTP